MSLSSLLRNQGPVRDWFVAHFPNTSSVCTAANRALRDGSEKEPCAVPPRPGADAGLVGTSVGYLLSAHLRAEALDMTAATIGAAALAPQLNLEPSPDSLERQAAERVRQLSPSTRHLVGAEWAELLRLCVLLARFEQVCRAGPPAVESLVPLVLESGRSLDALARAVSKEPTLQDLGALGRATVDDLLYLRGVEALHIGPTFAQSAALGGADADLIADGTLIELKSSGRPGIVGRNEAWQLLGYAFADTDDRYGIERCSVFALRRRRSFTWTVQQLMDTLAGTPVEPLDYWRVEFARLLASLAEERQRRIAELRRERAARAQLANHAGSPRLRARWPLRRKVPGV